LAPFPHVTCPLLHPAALAGFAPETANTAAASAPPNNLNAFRRGIGVARMRATLSIKSCMNRPVRV